METVGKCFALRANILPLLARGRDRLETVVAVRTALAVYIPYSLGDAIDWKREARTARRRIPACPLLARGRDRLETSVPHFCLDCKRSLLLARGRDRLETHLAMALCVHCIHLLLTRGCDRLETKLVFYLLLYTIFSYSLGDAIDWKLQKTQAFLFSLSNPLLARGRDRLETQ